MKRVEYKNILIVEDDEELRTKLVKYFAVTNNVISCGTLSSAIDRVSANTFDVIVLDIILPDGSGLKLFDYTGHTPVIILSDLSSESNQLNGLSAGAADYLVKPVSAELLEAHIALRLLPSHQARIISHGLELNTARRTAVYKDKQLDLTSSEFNILMFLMQNAGVLFKATEIYESIWKMPHLNTTTIKKHISNLRKKMLAVSDECANLIISEFGKGYGFIGNCDD